MKKIEDIRKTVTPEILVETDLLIAWVIKGDRGYVLAHPEYQLNFWQTRKIFRAIRQIKKGQPLAYITGHKEFFGLDFLVNKHTLIPRPDTEIMVEEAVKITAERGIDSKDLLFADIGTGSGCIAVSMAKNMPTAKIIATDTSRGALRTARKNAKLNKVNIHFFHGHLLKPLIDANRTSIPKHLFITANLPYLTKNWAESEPSLKYEPKNALIADTRNGLTLYEKLFQQAKLLAGDIILDILIEFDPRQAAEARQLAEKYFSRAKIRIKKDLAGRDRLLIISTSAN